jgi:hypothetical protein
MNEVFATRERDEIAKRIVLGKSDGKSVLEVEGEIISSRLLVTLDAGLDWRIDLSDIHQAELQLIITLSVLL